MSDVLDQAFGIGVGGGQKRFPTQLDRLIHLRTLPSLGPMDGPGLAFIAANATEHHFETGDAIFQPNEPVASLHFVAEGRVRLEQDGLHLLDVVPPFAFGFLPLLTESPVGQSAIALEPTVTLAVSRDDLFEVLEDDFNFLENSIRQLSRQFVEMQAKLEESGHIPRSDPTPTELPERPLDIVQRLELLGMGPLADVNLEALMQFARSATERRLSPGEQLWSEGDRSDYGLHVAHGVIACSSPRRSFRMGPGSVLGYGEAHGKLPRSYSAVAETRAIVLQQTTEVFFDVLEDNFEMAVGYLAFMARIALDMSLKEARIRAGR